MKARDGCAKLAWLVIGAVLLLMAQPLHASSEEDLLRERVRFAYSKLVEVEGMGADVNEAARLLDEALQMLSAAERSRNGTERMLMLARAEELINEVEARIPALYRLGEEAARRGLAMRIAAVALVVATAALLYRFWPRLLWGAWLRVRRRWVVKLR